MVAEASDGPTTAAPLGSLGTGPTTLTEGPTPPGVAAPDDRTGPTTPPTTNHDSTIATTGPRPCRTMADSLAYSAGLGSSAGSGSSPGRPSARQRARRSATTASCPRSLGS